MQDDGSIVQVAADGDTDVLSQRCERLSAPVVAFGSSWLAQTAAGGDDEPEEVNGTVTPLPCGLPSSPTRPDVEAVIGTLPKSRASRFNPRESRSFCALVWFLGHCATASETASEDIADEQP